MISPTPLSQNRPPLRRPLYGPIWMAAAAVLFGFFDTLCKHLTSFMPVANIVFLTLLIRAAMITPAVIRRKEKIWRGRKEFILLCLRGVLGAGAFLCMVRAMKMGTLSTTMVLFYTNPLWALIFGAIFLGEKLTIKRLYGIIAAFAGAALLMSNGQQVGSLEADLLGLASGLLIGGGVAVIRHLRRHFDPFIISGFHFITGAALIAPLANLESRPVTYGIMLSIVATSFLGLIGQLAMIQSFKYMKAAEGSAILVSEAILTAILGNLIYNETLTFRFFVASIMILGGAVYSSYINIRENA